MVAKGTSAGRPAEEHAKVSVEPVFLPPSSTGSDVVLIHGLHGDAAGTWQARGSSHWPPWLGEDLPNTAVWTVRYETRSWRQPVSIQDAASLLLAGLDLVGVGLRPLVVICHSMGGIVLKELVLRAQEADHPIKSALRGVVFLATPHLGSSLAIAAQLAWLLMPGSSPVLQLRPEPSYLSDVDRRFRDLHLKLGLRVLAFSETRRMPFRRLGVFIVRTESSDPRLPGVQSVPVDRSHTTICKFKDRRDTTYRQIFAFTERSLSSRSPLEAQADRFERSLAGTLAGGTLIPRAASEDAITRIDLGTDLVFVRGIAGSGKSGVALEIVQKLRSQGRAVLPFSLATVERSHRSLREFAVRELGLADTVSRTLTAAVGKERAVLLIDQLDAVRWGSAHSSSAWELARDLMEEVLGHRSQVGVIVCCRGFDLETDRSIRSWRDHVATAGIRAEQRLYRPASSELGLGRSEPMGSSGSQERRRDPEPAPIKIAEVEVGHLSETQVLKALREAGANEAVDEPQLALLRRVHHLQMWLSIAASREHTAPLADRRTLLDAFWRSRRDAMAAAGIRDPVSLEDKLLRRLRYGKVLNGSISSFPTGGRELDILQSLHLVEIDWDARQFSFAHQSYLEYLIASRLADEIDKDGLASVRKWLGETSDQSLFRREQLRMLLDELRSRSVQTYVEASRQLLASDAEIRFHLQLLVLQTFGQTELPKSAEADFIFEQLQDDRLSLHILHDVFHGHAGWIAELERVGLLRAWLSEPRKSEARQRALWLLRSVAERAGDLVFSICDQSLGDSAEDLHDFGGVLSYRPAEDTDLLFHARLKLICADHADVDGCDWAGLASEHPRRLLLLVEAALKQTARRLERNEEVERQGSLAQVYWHGLPAIVDFRSLEIEEAFTRWESLVAAIAAVSDTGREDFEGTDVLETYAVRWATFEPAVRVCSSLCSEILGRDDGLLRRMTKSVRDRSPGQIVLALSLCELEDEISDRIADQVLLWLMGNQNRLQLKSRQGSGEFAVSSRLLEKYAQRAPSDRLVAFQEWLMALWDPETTEKYGYRREHLGETKLMFPSVHGRALWVLGRALPQSPELARRLEELDRKFGGPPPAREASWDDEDLHVGSVRSAIDDEAADRFQDKTWLKIASSTGIGRNQNWDRDSQSFRSSGVDSIRGNFRRAAQLDPERFCRLLMRWPVDGRVEFFTAVLDGLAHPADAKRLPDGRAWVPPSLKSLEEVLALPLTLEVVFDGRDSYTATVVARIVKRYSELAWSEKTLGLLVELAENHPDPVATEGGDLDVAAPENTALNSVRGAAAYAMQSLLFAEGDRYSTLAPALESLVKDCHPAVRVAAVSALLPLLNADRDTAVALFLEACSEPGHIVAGSDPAYRFLNYAHHTHLQRLLGLLDSMLKSDSQRVRRRAAWVVAVAHIYNGQVAPPFNACLQGDESIRAGIAAGAAAVFRHDPSNRLALTTVLDLANDDAEDVQKAVSRAFSGLDLAELQHLAPEFAEFAASRAFGADPSPLLHSLEECSSDLSYFSDCILEAARRFGGPLASQAGDIRFGLAADTHTLLPLIQRVYEQAVDKRIRERCLDVWDLLLEKRVGRAHGLLDRLAQLS